MNIFLCVLIVVFGGATGFFCSFRLNARLNALEIAVLLSERLQIEMRYSAAGVEDILRNLAREERFSRITFIKDIAENGDSNGNFHPRWSEGVAAIPYLNAEDKALLLSLGEGLGTTDLDGQLKLIEINRELLCIQCDEARRDVSSKGKMYRSVGVLCGLAAGIVVL